MQLNIDGISYEFIELKAYREIHELPYDFNIALFEPKSYVDLGSIEGVGPILVAMKEAVFTQLPHYSTPHQWLIHEASLRDLFCDELLRVNDQVRLRPAEVDFAVNGFGDVCSKWIYALIYAYSTKTAPPPFADIYQQWLDDGVRIAQTAYPYIHQGVEWQIQVVWNAYGRVGLKIQRDEKVDYVSDNRLACPAERLMQGILTEVASQIKTRCGL
jgi:hypothetical protein